MFAVLVMDSKSPGENAVKFKSRIDSSNNGHREKQDMAFL